jgi:hypothetical protein
MESAVAVQPPFSLPGTRPDRAFGEVDDLDLSLTGRSKGGVTASCKGTAKQAPGLTLEATLVRMDPKHVD